jgi:hypothetical protein
MAQRRTRHGARFQTALNLAWDPAPLVALLALDAEERVRAVAALSEAVVAVPGPADRLIETFLSHLP